MEQQQQLTAIVRGYVQGVGFRYFVRRQAQALGLTGWVRNRPDGSVEVVAEGERSTLGALLGALRSGPSEADVQDIDVKWETYTAAFTQFEVRF